VLGEGDTSLKRETLGLLKVKFPALKGRRRSGHLADLADTQPKANSAAVRGLQTVCPYSVPKARLTNGKRFARTKAQEGDTLLRREETTRCSDATWCTIARHRK